MEWSFGSSRFNCNGWSRWWQLKYFFKFHPEPWGRWTHFDGRIFFKWVETTKIFSSGFFPPKEWSLLLSYKEGQAGSTQPVDWFVFCFVESRFLRGRDKINPPNLGGTSKPEDVVPEAPSGIPWLDTAYPCLRGTGYLYSKWIVTRIITSKGGLYVPQTRVINLHITSY